MPPGPSRTSDPTSDFHRGCCRPPAGCSGGVGPQRPVHLALARIGVVGGRLVLHRTRRRRTARRKVARVEAGGRDGGEDRDVENQMEEPTRASLPAPKGQCLMPTPRPRNSQRRT